MLSLLGEPRTKGSFSFMDLGATGTGRGGDWGGEGSVGRARSKKVLTPEAEWRRVFQVSPSPHKGEAPEEGLGRRQSPSH